MKRREKVTEMVVPRPQDLPYLYGVGKTGSALGFVRYAERRNDEGSSRGFMEAT